MSASLYTPSVFRESDETILLAFIHRYPFATLVTSGSEGISVSHLPILAQREPVLKFYGHLARANPHSRKLDGRPAVAIFRGPDSYISPAWYSTKDRVPTWNYAVVHVTGTIAAVTDAARLAAILDKTTATFESVRPDPWDLSELSAEYRAQLSRDIVGFTMDVAALEGKFKLSQNLAPEDQLGAITGLMNEPTDQSGAMAQLMARACGHCLGADTTYSD